MNKIYKSVKQNWGGYLAPAEQPASSTFYMMGGVA